MKTLRAVLTGLAVAATLVTASVFGPPFLFEHKADYGQWRVWSDRPMDVAALARVLDEADRRLATGPGGAAGAPYRVFFCHDKWRLRLLAHNALVGGAADGVVTRHIYIRENDLETDRIIPPGGRLADARDRPLSYFLAHEAMHIWQSREVGRLPSFLLPVWLREGHADLVAKAGAFDVEANLALLAAGDRRLDAAASGLYRQYHLMVWYLHTVEGRTLASLYDDPPDAAAVMARLRRYARDRVGR